MGPWAWVWFLTGFVIVYTWMKTGKLRKKLEEWKEAHDTLDREFHQLADETEKAQDKWRKAMLSGDEPGRIYWRAESYRLSALMDENLKKTKALIESRFNGRP